jgi:hypothetical protein
MPTRHQRAKYAIRSTPIRFCGTGFVLGSGKFINSASALLARPTTLRMRGGFD